MEPKDKAKELVDKFRTIIRKADVYGVLLSEDEIYLSKQSALLAVNEIIESSPSLPILGDGGTYGEDIELSKVYWQEVKQEIENL